MFSGLPSLRRPSRRAFLGGLGSLAVLPAFAKLDAQASYFLPFRDGSSLVFYLALSNVLNRANVIDYEYTADYAERTERTTNFRRSVYFGVTVTLTP